MHRLRSNTQLYCRVARQLLQVSQLPWNISQVSASINFLEALTEKLFHFQINGVVTIHIVLDAAPSLLAACCPYILCQNKWFIQTYVTTWGTTLYCPNTRPKWVIYTNELTCATEMAKLCGKMLGNKRTFSPNRGTSNKVFMNRQLEYKNM
jgi:hypothetical protein